MYNKLSLNLFYGTIVLVNMGHGGWSYSLQPGARACFTVGYHRGWLVYIAISMIFIFFYVGLPKEDIFFDHHLYFSQHYTHVTNYNFSHAGLL